MAGEPTAWAETLRDLTWRAEPMTDAQVIETVTGLVAASSAVLSLRGSPIVGDETAEARFLQGELGEALRPALESVRTMIGWMSNPDVETREIHAAIAGWLS